MLKDEDYIDGVLKCHKYYDKNRGTVKTKYWFNSAQKMNEIQYNQMVKMNGKYLAWHRYGVLIQVKMFEDRKPMR